MSRMTGRKSIDHNKNNFTSDYDVLHSINYIKGKIVKNINISEQKKVKRRKQKGMIPSSSY